MSEHVKIHFPLEQDDEGYPPVAVESLWATPTEHPLEYIVDNIPFFAMQATLGDSVKVRSEDGTRWFDRLVNTSGNSLLRVVPIESTQIPELRTALERLGCSTEWDKHHNLIAVNVPPDVELETVQHFLSGQADSGKLDYEEPILRQ